MNPKKVTIAELEKMVDTHNLLPDGTVVPKEMKPEEIKILKPGEPLTVSNLQDLKGGQMVGLSSLGFPKDKWSKEDWKDFYFSLKRCAARMRKRRQTKIDNDTGRGI